MLDCNPVDTPLPPGLKFSKSMSPQSPEDAEAMCDVPYLSALGALQYLATMTRPDIAYAVSFLGRFSSNPGLQHWAALKHLHRYVKGIMGLKLTYTSNSSSPGTSVTFSTFCDASHGDCVDSGHSTGAYVTTMEGGAVGWSSKLQPIVALSSTEAEYMAAVEAGCWYYLSHSSRWH